MWLPHSFILLLLAALVNGSITNTTVDDTSSSFTFSGAWNTITPTAPCHICSSKPDTSQIHGGTYRDGNIRDGASPTTGSFSFQGSAVYIFGIDQAISQPNIVFTLGDVKSTHHYTGTERFVYDALFFSATGLAADQTHTVDWNFDVNKDSGVAVQAALFDYALVTSGEADVKTTAAPPTGKSTTSSPPSTSSKASSSTRSSGNGNTLSNPSSVSSSATSKATSLDQPSPQKQTSSATVTVSGITTVTAQSAAGHAKSNVGPIIGAVVGALVLAVLALFFLFLRSRRARRAHPQPDKAAHSQFLRLDNYPLQSRHSSPQHPDTREVSTAAPVSLPPSLSKSYLDTRAGASTVTLLRDAETPQPTGSSLSSHLDRDREDESPASATTTNRDLRFLEDRLATLEAQVAVQQHPPPYVHEDERPV